MQPAPPCPAPACWWQTQVTGLVLHWQLRILWVFFPLSQLCCPLRFPTDPPVRGFPTVWKLLLLPTPSPGQVSVANSFVSFFVFCILSYLLSKRLGCLSGCLVSSPSVQKLFWGSCSAFKWYFDEFVEEKVVSPSYSSTVSGPSLICLYIFLKFPFFSSLVKWLFKSVLFRFHTLWIFLLSYCC